MTPFWLPKAVAIAAAAVFAVASEARWVSKMGVIALVLLSLILQHAFASVFAWTSGLVLQVAVSVFVLVYLKLGT